jgi:hypothetical protein
VRRLQLHQGDDFSIVEKILYNTCEKHNNIIIIKFDAKQRYKVFLTPWLFIRLPKIGAPITWSIPDSDNAYPRKQKKTLEKGFYFIP